MAIMALKLHDIRRLVIVEQESELEKGGGTVIVCQANPAHCPTHVDIQTPAHSTS